MRIVTVRKNSLSGVSQLSHGPINSPYIQYALCMVYQHFVTNVDKRTLYSRAPARAGGFRPPIPNNFHDADRTHMLFRAWFWKLVH